MASCGVCAETYTLARRKPVACPYCDYAACASCHERYLLESPLDLHCMSCRRAWSREFVDSSFPRAFTLARYKTHREQVLADREKALLPATQTAYKNYKLAKELQAAVAEREVEITAYKRKVSELYALNNYAHSQVWRIKNSNFETDGTTGEGRDRGQTSRALTWARKCPVAECRGYLAATTFVCGVCEAKVCKECHDVLGDDVGDNAHECDEDAKQTAALLARDTKPCPNCNVPIFKISGCSQIWCTHCRTAFDWRTGQIETGHVHNPHYYEWMRREGRDIPRDPADIPCGDNVYISVYEMEQLLRTHPGLSREARDDIRTWHRLLGHVRATRLGPMNAREAQDDLNLDLRLRYLDGVVADDEFQHTLQKREKARQKHRDLQHVYQMFVTAGYDVIRQVSRHPFTHNDAAGLLDQLTKLREYADECLANIAKRYNSVRYRITF